MTISDILHDLQTRHGADWPQAAMNELIFLVTCLAIDPTAITKKQLTDRYLLIHAWILSTLQAGIAARQVSSLEH